MKGEFIPPHYHLFYFDIREASDLDANFRRLLREAYHLGGEQKFLRKRGEVLRSQVERST